MAGADRTALVVDDERDLREVIAEVLAAEGYDVSTAANGREALDQARTASPDIMLLDLMMPVMSGWEVVQVMKSDDRLRSIPIVVISAHPAPPDGIPVVAKPFQIEDLLARMDREIHRAPFS